MPHIITWDTGFKSRHSSRRNGILAQANQQPQVAFKQVEQMNLALLTQGLQVGANVGETMRFSHNPGW